MPVGYDERRWRSAEAGPDGGREEGAPIEESKKEISQVLGEIGTGEKRDEKPYQTRCPK